MPTYQGLDLLTIAPNLATSWTSSVARPVDGLATAHANVVTATTTAPATETKTLEWGVVTRADLATLETFLAARKGQLVACWIPDPQWTLPIINSTLAYVDFAPGAITPALCALVQGEARYQYWFGRTPGSTGYGIKRFDSTITDNGDGTCRWQGSGEGDLTTSTTVYSRLMLCRMASDSYRVTYRTGNVATVSADFVEVVA